MYTVATSFVLRPVVWFLLVVCSPHWRVGFLFLGRRLLTHSSLLLRRVSSSLLPLFFSHLIASHHITSHHITSHHITSHITSHHISHHNIQQTHRQHTYTQQNNAQDTSHITQPDITRLDIELDITQLDIAGAPPLCRCFCVAGVGLGGAAGGLMYALALFGLRGSVAAFVWQAWDLVHLQGVRCTFWRRLVSAALPLLLRGRRGTWRHCRGSDVRFGVVWSPRLCRCFCVAGVGLGASAGGPMYVLASLSLRRAGRWTFAWQAWDLLHLHGV